MKNAMIVTPFSSLSYLVTVYSKNNLESHLCTWLLCKRDCNACEVEKKYILPLQMSKHSVAKSLLLERKPASGESGAGRPRRSIETLYTEKKERGHKNCFNS